MRFIVRLALLFLLFVAAFAAAAVRPAHAQTVLPPEFVPDAAALTRAFGKMATEPLPGGFVLAVPPDTVSAQDARYGWLFARAAFVYAPRRDRRGNVGLGPAVVIHHAPSDADAARRTARLCARLLRLHRERFVRDTEFPRGSDRAHVWLYRQLPATARTTAGGESQGNHLYIFDTAVPRTAIEWTRTIAHEWGHVTLPAARGFSAPENDAAGFLGERLYLKWLYEETVAGKGTAGDDWTDAPGLSTYHARQIAPLIARFHEIGPIGSGLDDRDERAMNLYIGAALATDHAFGPELLGRGLFSILGVGPRDLLTALRNTVAAALVVPIRLPAWVPLARTTYQVRGDGIAHGSVLFAERPPLALREGGKAELTVLQPGWKWVRPGAGGPEKITLRQRARAGL